MKYLHKYKILEKFGINSFSDNELDDRLKWLRIEQKEIQDEITLITKILIKRKDDNILNMSKDWPKSIYDLNKEQLDYIFVNNNSISTVRHNISDSYLNQLVGINAFGYNQETNQFSFNIRTSDWIDDATNRYKHNVDGIKSIKFLTNHIKPSKTLNDGLLVEFGVSYEYDDSYNDKIYIYSDNKIVFKKGYSTLTFKSINDLIIHLVEYDIESSDGD